MAQQILVQRRFESLFNVKKDMAGSIIIEPTHRFMRFLEELTGNSNEFISTFTDLNEFDDLFQPDANDQVKDDVVVTAVDYTTIGNQTVVCTNTITIKLNDEPDDRELAKIHASDGRVDINGNGKKINKQDDVIIKRNFTTLDILYLVEMDEWVII